jgi:hypothetical protein
MTPNPTWRKLKPVDELSIGLYPYNRWGMVYHNRKGGWRCMSCQEDFHVSVAARNHYCPWEIRWRSWSGRNRPTITRVLVEEKPTKKGLVEEKPIKTGLMDRFFNFFRG